MNWIYPLRRTIPLAMLVSSVLFAATLYLLEVYRAEKQYREQQELLIAHNGYQLSTLIRDALSREDWETAGRHLRSLVTLPNLRQAFVIDDQHRIRLATDYRLRDQTFRSLAVRPEVEVLERVSQRLSGEIIALADGSLWAIYPIGLPLGEGDVRSDRVGHLVMTLDLAVPLAQARQIARENTLFIFLGSIFIGLLLWLYLDLFLVRRISNLSHSIRRWRSHKEVIPVVSGRDEVAELGRHVSQVSREFAQQYGQLRALFEQSFQVIFIVHRNGRLIDANLLALQLIDGNIDQLRGKKLWETPWWNYSPVLKKQLREDLLAVAEGQLVLRQVVHYDTHQESYNFNYSYRAVRDAQTQDVQWLLVEGRDVTQLLESEQGRQELVNFFSMLSDINSAIARAESTAELLPKICDIIVDQSQISGVWIGLVNHEAGRLDVVACAGITQSSLQNPNLSLEDSPVGEQGPAVQAVKQGKVIISNFYNQDFPLSPVLEAAEGQTLFPVSSAASYPLYQGKTLVGCLNLLGKQEQLFSASLVKQLNKLADDVSFALTGIADRSELKLMAKVFDSAHESIMVTNAERIVMVVNNAFSEITGFASEEILGTSITLMNSTEDASDYYQAMWDVVDEVGYWQGELFLRRKSGETYPALISISALRDHTQQITHYVCMGTDISEHKEAEEHVRYLAYNDPLTGLPNRMLLYDRGEQILKSADKQGEIVAVIFLDLDRFKHINESLGHNVGDRLLKMVAGRLQKKLNEEDSIGRLGGDEFLVILPGAPANRAAHMASSLLNEFNQAFQVNNHSLNLTCSAGIAMFPQDGASFSELHQHADVAMYKAKELGRNRYHFFTSELNIAATERLILENALRDALELKQVSLQYQPQVEINSGALVGVEALLRWTHPKFGIISPIQFIGIAEETGQINRIGEWVLIEACRQLGRWQRQGVSGFVMAVNVSAMQFVDGQIYEALSRALDDTGIDPKWLEIEITESVFAYDMQEIMETMQKINRLGVSIAVDDFGTGYSSFSYLKRFPLDKLKIDRSFVKDIVDGKDDMKIAEGIINLGHSLDMRVIAEGVETREQLAILKHMHCDMAQGYLFSKPLDADVLLAFIEKDHLLPGKQ